MGGGVGASVGASVGVGVGLVWPILHVEEEEEESEGQQSPQHIPLSQSPFGVPPPSSLLHAQQLSCSVPGQVEWRAGFKRPCWRRTSSTARELAQLEASTPSASAQRWSSGGEPTSHALASVPASTHCMCLPFFQADRSASLRVLATLYAAS